MFSKNTNDKEFLKQLHDRNMYCVDDIVKMILQREKYNIKNGAISNHNGGYIVDIFNNDYPISRLNQGHGKFIADDEYSD